MGTPRLRLVHDPDEELDEREISVLLSDDVVARIMDMLDARRANLLSFHHAEGVFDG
jgi:hypothetical protein